MPPAGTEMYTPGLDKTQDSTVQNTMNNFSHPDYLPHVPSGAMSLAGIHMCNLVLDVGHKSSKNENIFTGNDYINSGESSEFQQLHKFNKTPYASCQIARS